MTVSVLIISEITVRNKSQEKGEITVGCYLVACGYNKSSHPGLNFIRLQARLRFHGPQTRANPLQAYFNSTLAVFGSRSHGGHRGGGGEGRRCGGPAPGPGTGGDGGEAEGRRGGEAG